MGAAESGWISALVFIHFRRPEINDGCDISCLADMAGAIFISPEGDGLIFFFKGGKESSFVKSILTQFRR